LREGCEDEISGSSSQFLAGGFKVNELKLRLPERERYWIEDLYLRIWKVLHHMFGDLPLPPLFMLGRGLSGRIHA